MKKIILGTLALGMIVITGCDKEDENNNNESNSETKTSGEICDGSVFTWKDVTNPITSKTWMDRNLGASQVATSSTDSLAYGDLYQWGRGSDGHQCRNSDTTSVLSNTDTPGHDKFIIDTYVSSTVYGDIIVCRWWNNWSIPQSDSLWQGVDGVNNPCPSGYRIPTKTEWEEEVESWTSDDANGALGSVLKLPMAGYRNGSLNYVGTYGVYWSSTVSGTVARNLNFDSSNANLYTYDLADGISVRCIKD